MEKKITIDNLDDFELILSSAIRYSLGRQTYLPSVVIRFVRPLLPQLSELALRNIIKDIEKVSSYGNETIDKPEWMRFLTDVQFEISKREKSY